MNLFRKWSNFKELLPSINKIYIPRRCVLVNNHTRLELHAFSDASVRAYRAAIYLKSINYSDKFSVRLLAANSRVAPLKQITISRLELCAIILSAQLAGKFKSILNIKIDAEYYWCVSEITLCWIKAPSIRWKTFVAHRVSEIQTLT